MFTLLVAGTHSLAEVHQPEEHSCIIGDGRLALKCQGGKASHQVLGAAGRLQLREPQGFGAKGHLRTIWAPKLPKSPHSLLSSYKRTTLDVRSWLMLLFDSPNILSLSRIHSFPDIIHHSSIWGEEICMPILQVGWPRIIRALGAGRTSWFKVSRSVLLISGIVELGLQLFF